MTSDEGFPGSEESPTTDPTADPAEGVRIISAEEIEQAAERGGVARRRGQGQKYGDRPPPPPDDVQPAIRFPLAGTSDARDIERPRVAPVEPRRAEGSVPPRPEPPAPPESQVPPEPPAPAAAAPFPEDSGDERPAPAPRPSAPPADDAPPHGDPLTGPPAYGSSDVTRVVVGESSEPVLDLGPPTGESLLPHWTEPATGQVPRVVVGDEAPSDPDEEARWSQYAAGSTRWRGEHDTTDHGDLMADLANVPEDDDDHRLGALDTSERTSDEAFLNFDDVDLAAEADARRGRGRGRRGRGRRDDVDVPDPGDVAEAAITGALGLEGADTPRADLPPPPPAAASAAPRRSREPRPARPRPPAPPADTVAPDDDPAAPRPRRRRPEPTGDEPPAGRNVRQAAIVGVAIAVVALIAFWIGPAAAMVVVTVVVALAGAEYFQAVQRGGFRPATLLGLVAVAVLPAATYWRGEGAMPLVLFLSLVVGVLWYLLGVGGRARPTANLGVTMVGVVWVGVLGAYAALILRIPVEGVSILLVTVIAAVAADVGGFFVGRSMGRTPLVAASPHKTVEGLVGGILGTLVAVFLVAVVLGVGPLSAGQALVFGLVTALAAPLGDLAESLFKRDLGIKDMGSLLPEHGGLLDRFDGMLFVLPTAYYLVRAFGLA
ncbi:phosphatidate cytidylyltransferase [Rhabdothermincola salaria]|uniref:phosphatidate cytidylyltransferase n=1 Tax=Rhabdothermincola salaria TaxID=2903142 RepID=UPI001E4BDA23|nr:phosphatidate cytidylyltransferase [Rhabdothermincola salaria]MCD9624924.1 phosphatidate cytidylyltransferase [Rhabdothermincola salaria]